mgnify:CR=1 FL=1
MGKPTRNVEEPIVKGIENPRVRGSIPRLGTTYLYIKGLHLLQVFFVSRLCQNYSFDMSWRLPQMLTCQSLPSVNPSQTTTNHLTSSTHTGTFCSEYTKRLQYAEDLGSTFTI